MRTRNLVKITFLEEWRRLVWTSISLQNLLQNEGMVHPYFPRKARGARLGVVDVVDRGRGVATAHAHAVTSCEAPLRAVSWYIGGAYFINWWLAVLFLEMGNSLETKVHHLIASVKIP